MTSRIRERPLVAGATPTTRWRVYDFRTSGKPCDPLRARPTLDLWSFATVLFRAIAHRPLLERDDQGNLRGKHERMVLHTWCPETLSKALADAAAALIEVY